MSEFELKASGFKYAGWESVRVTRSLEELAHSFSAGLADHWTEDNVAIPIEAGDACEVALDGEVITTGYVDTDGLRYDANSHSLTFQGRSKTGDLVDCAAIHATGQWKKAGLLRIARDISTPFGISVSSEVSDLGKAFENPSFTIADGETAFQCLERAARARGVLLQTDADGNVVFTRAGTARITTVLEYGKNIKRCTKQNSWRERFSEYIIKTQSSGNDQLYGAATSIKRTSEDKGVTRYRPTIIVADNEDSGTELQKRADWERNVRAGRSLRYTYVTPGWKHDTGLWEPNRLVHVVDPEARLDDELLIVKTTQSRDNTGTLTTLELTLKEAFDVQPLPLPKRKSGAAW